MKTRMLKMCIPLALALAAGCATQSKNDGSGNASSNPATPSSASSSGTASGSPSGAMSASGSPGERSVYFEFDKSALSAEDRKIVESNAQYLKEHPGMKARVEGNADERGSKEYNLALGQRRAESVTKAMQLLGVKGDRLEAVSYGEEKPKATGHDEQSWAQNRRSDIRY